MIARWPMPGEEESNDPSPMDRVYQSLRKEFTEEAYTKLMEEAVPILVWRLKHHGFFRISISDLGQIAIDTFNDMILISQKFDNWQKILAYMKKVARSRAAGMNHERDRTRRLKENVQIGDREEEGIFGRIDLTDSFSRFVHDRGLCPVDARIFEALIEGKPGIATLSGELKMSKRTIMRRRRGLKAIAYEFFNAFWKME